MSPQRRWFGSALMTASAMMLAVNGAGFAAASLMCLGAAALVLLTRSPRALAVDAVVLIGVCLTLGAWFERDRSMIGEWLGVGCGAVACAIWSSGPLRHRNAGRWCAVATMVTLAAKFGHVTPLYLAGAVLCLVAAGALLVPFEPDRFSVTTIKMTLAAMSLVLSTLALIAVTSVGSARWLAPVAGVGLMAAVTRAARVWPDMRTALRADVLRSDMDTSALPEVEISAEGELVTANMTMRQWWGGELPPSILSVVHVKLWEELEFAMRRASETARDVTVDLLLHPPHDRVRTVTATVAAIDGSETPACIVTFMDRTESVERDAARERQLSEMRTKAQTDALTGLANRDAVLAELERRLAGAGATLLFLDLDGFKAVNDTYGHAVGDEVLRVVAKRLNNLVRDSNVVARLGGDEFVIIGDPNTWPDARIRSLIATVSEVIEVEGLRMSVGVSVGLATAGPGASAASLLERADAQMYEVKRRRKQSAARTPRVPAGSGGTAGPVEASTRRPIRPPN